MLSTCDFQTEKGVIIRAELKFKEGYISVPAYKGILAEESRGASETVSVKCILSLRAGHR
eukprot:1153058-Pelagomonas_calceolata.AAC.1